MSSESRFSPPVEEALLSFGWFVGRKVDTAEYMRVLTTYNMPIVGAAVTAFSEFGYLTIWSVDRLSGTRSAPCVFDPGEIEGVGMAELCSKIGSLVGSKASPVAIVDDMHPVFVYGNGSVCMSVYSRDVYNIGISMDMALSNNIVHYRNADVYIGRV